MSEPLITWRRLRAGNERFAASDRGRLAELPTERPTAVAFRCADFGFASEAIFGQNAGSLIDISTWGHVIDTGVLATLEYAVDTLEVPLIVVLGHQDCGAIRMAMRAWNDAVLPGGATRAAVEHAMGSIVHRAAQADSIEAVTSAHIVDTGLALLERSPAVSRRVDERQCGIVCATTNPEDGRLVALATIGAVGGAEDSLLECI